MLPNHTNTDIFAPPCRVDLASDLFSQVLRKQVTVPRGKDTRWLEGKLRETRRKIQSLNEYCKPGHHFGVENPKITVPPAIANLKIIEKHLEMSLMGWPSLLHPSFLSWMRSDGPEFMVTTWDNPLFSLCVDTSSQETTFTTTPYLVPELAVQYYPAIKKLVRLFHRERGTATITAEYAGAIPQKTFNLMELARESKLFNCFYVAAGAPKKWIVDKEVVATEDPIVFAGVSMGKDIPMQFFVIDVFEPSPSEEAALLRHSTEI